LQIPKKFRLLFLLFAFTGRLSFAQSKQQQIDSVTAIINQVAKNRQLVIAGITVSGNKKQNNILFYGRQLLKLVTPFQQHH